MKKILSHLCLLLLSFVDLQASHENIDATHIKMNNIPPRLQWYANEGYCGEVCLISAGLYYGQYVSQYTARQVASNNAPQNKSQLLLGVNDQTAASKMHLKSIEWNTDKEEKTNDFLVWVKKYVVQGYPVAIGIFTNEYLFYGNTKSNAGDPDYDHIVPVIGIGSKHSLTSSTYYADDMLYFSDNGLWVPEKNPVYFFNSAFGAFQKNRQNANAKKGLIYSLANNASNYGIVITGVMDQHGDTLPVRIKTNVNNENPSIKAGSNSRPKSSSITLTVTVSNLKPNVSYNLYKYNDLNKIPNSNFNGNKKNAVKSWKVKIKSGTQYTMTQKIQSNEVAAFRAVKADAK